MMPLGIAVGLSPGDFVLDGDPAPSPKSGGAPNFRRTSIVPNGCMDQDITGYGGRPRLRRLCVRWAPSYHQNIAHPPHPIFGPCVLWPNGRMDQDATWCRDRPRHRRHCVRWTPSSPSPNGWPMSIVAKLLDGSRCHLLWRKTSAQAILC